MSFATTNLLKVPSFVARVGALFFYIMDAKELRIGNLLTNTIDDKIISVMPLEIECAYGMNGHFNLTFETIQLTEEWLVKFGFVKEKHEDGYFYRLNCIYFDDRFELCTMDNSGYSWLNIGEPLQHVHQLQNLYFALTGQELTHTTN